MAHVAEDYYDMPADELPSANFAGRPTSDIDMLGGYWNLATHYSSSSEDDDDDSNIRASPQRRNLSRPCRPAPKLQRRAGEKGPSTTTSTISPTDDISHGSGVTGSGWRVSQRREQQTASGSLEARTSPLFGPSRVKRKRKTRTQSCDETGSGTATSRPIIPTSTSRTRAMSGPPGGGEAISPCAKQSRTSVAHPTRVRRMGQSTQLAALDTGVAADESKSRKFASSPSSVLLTPRELYGIGDGQADRETAARAWQAAANIMGSPLSSSSRSNTHCCNEQAGGRVDVADPRNIDWPGAMMPARESVRVRRDSVATGLDASTFDTKLGSEEKRYDTEQVGPGEDDIVTFFEEFGVVVEATEATLDQFWLRHSCTAEDDRSDAAMSTISTVSSVRISGVGEAKAETPQIDQQSQSGRQSRFSLSSASSCSAPKSRPQKRKRSRLRDLLLSPGLPGTAFLKIPAS
ncbi:hypothetical protein yc1106_04408 [Curvularia clavata]|uniref:Uncharacterized protein n=1 Tax=Curvularia clavata TaxID=95742 RepID=A0A9Q8Z927_CURCL|nr:hypothetical protein yc1106_04408 [Curvularia clavata]